METQTPHLLSLSTRDDARAALARAFEEAATMPGTLLPPEILEELTDVARQIVAEVVASDHQAFVVDRSEPWAYIVEHSIDAAVIGLMVGRLLVPEDALDELGTGLFLQDIGMLALPESVVQKPGPLAADERELMMQHPVLGLEFLRHDSVSPVAKSVVRSHHERWNGSGYPSGLAGEEISLFARIAAVADVFDAVTSERHHAPASSQQAGVAAVREGAGTALDPELVEVFGEVVVPHPPGSEIELPDGGTGVVASVTDEGPVVRVAGVDVAIALAA